MNISIIKEFKVSDMFLNERHVVHCMIENVPFSISYNEDFMMQVNSISKGHIVHTPIRSNEPGVEITPDMEITPEITISQVREIIMMRASLEEAYNVLSS